MVAMFAVLSSLLLFACGTEDVTTEHTEIESEVTEGNISDEKIRTIELNTTNQNAAIYKEQDGEWKRQLGLYSFYADEKNVFVDDSGNNRIIWKTMSDEEKFIELPDNMVCMGMVYDEETNVLHLLLFDNEAVEPEGEQYVSVDLTDSQPKIEIESDKTFLNAFLNAKGEIIENRDTVATLDQLIAQAQQLGVSLNYSLMEIYQLDNISLYSCTAEDDSSNIMFILTEQGKIVGYTGWIARGIPLLQMEESGILVKTETGIKEYCLLQDPYNENEIQIMEIPITWIEK
jgi:uncharacterized protein YcfL